MANKSRGKTYYSFDEIGQELFGLKPYRRVTKDKQKLEAQRDKFLGTCPHCGEKLGYIYGTNIVACINENCKGKKIVTKNDAGEEEIKYKPYFRILRDNGSEIGTTLFGEEKKEKENGRKS